MHNKNQISRLFIHADNVHSGGGAVLLKKLMGSKSADKAFIQVDSRMNLDCRQSNQFIAKVFPSIFGRFKAQYWLRKNVLSGDTVLCFGNLPPLFKLKGRVLVFVQNKYIVDNVSLKNFSSKTMLRLVFERIWFRLCSKFADEFIVQTPSMKIALEICLKQDNTRGDTGPIVNVLPLGGEILGKKSYPLFSNSQVVKKFDFIYPASGEPHKNHKNLIDAFIILAEEGYFPSLVLTLDVNKFNETLKSIELAKNTFKLNILNMGFLPHEELLRIYSSTRYLVYPSLYESFGIPLLEAKQAGLFIVAAELDYVRDSINPDQSFDPNSAVSIARAIKRSLGISEEPAVMLSADEFLSKITTPVQNTAI